MTFTTLRGVQRRCFVTERVTDTPEDIDIAMDRLYIKSWKKTCTKTRGRQDPPTSSLKSCCCCRRPQSRQRFASRQWGRPEPTCKDCTTADRFTKVVARAEKLKEERQKASAVSYPSPRPTTPKPVVSAELVVSPKAPILVVPVAVAKAMMVVDLPEPRPRARPTKCAPASVVPACEMQQAQERRYDFTVLGSVGAPSCQRINVRTGPGIHHPWVRQLRMGDKVKSDGCSVRGDGAMQDYQHSGNWRCRISEVDAPPEYVASALLSSIFSGLRM